MENNEDHLGPRAKFAFGLCSVAAGLLAGSISAPAVASETPAFASPQAFDIPSQPLDSALTELADRAGLKLLYRADTARQARSHKVAGNYTPQQALDIMLHDTGLSYRLTDDGAVTIEKPRTEFSTESLLAAAGEFELVKAEPEEKPWTGPVEQLDMKVIGGDLNLTSPSITESQTKLNRVPGGTTVIDGARIREGATVTVTDTLASAPGVYVGDATTGAAGPSRISIRGSDVNSTVGGPMRGLKVLRNGMPFTRANGAFDTQTMNLYAIDHIDVYRGASALEYGGSNLGGALNFITPTGYTADPLKIGMIWGTNGHVNPTVSAARIFDNGFDVYGAFSYLDTNTTRKNNDQETFHGHGNIGYRWNENQETRLSFDIQENDFLVATGLTKQQIDINPRRNQNSFSLGNGVRVYRGDLKHSVKLDNGDHFDVGAYYFNTQFNFDFTGGMNRDKWQDTGFNWRHEINGDLLGMKNRLV